MQATVATYDPETGAGSVLLDDGVEVPFPAEALAGSRLRLLRPGQRVRVETAGDGAGIRITALQILTLA
jgi:cold shock CspA family protein